jgi:hypothetical protein
MTALRFLLLFCSMMFPAAKPGQGERAHAAPIDVLSCKSVDASRARGQTVGRDVTKIVPLGPALAIDDDNESESDSESEDGFQSAVGLVLSQIRIAPTASRSSLIDSAFQANHFSIGRIPLRC